MRIGNHARTRWPAAAGLALWLLPAIALASETPDPAETAPAPRRVAPVRVVPAAPVTPVLTARPEVPAVEIFTPPPRESLAALPRAEGLPEPSVIVGLLNPGTEDLPVWSDLATRTRLRQDDPEGFARLVAAGALDPPEDALPRAIQTELARMNCYRGGIDGLWGEGSRAAVARYFAERGLGPAPDAPSPGLFRRIVAAEDVACPAPPAPTTARAQAPRRQTAPEPSGGPAPPIRLSPALGVFR
ncbi:hypothetical protein [Rhodovulum kholense]|uniref:Peptidoglycan binding protein n=1 Tax=Rhodovulum kholense TaxID=453584 RepID=A0A8E3APS3_9RHOB|nr:hypothetical protein [Rhodovulum kholense]PTW46571.1 hypothetical protein C8N38_11155 [Rhodovulum kholense]